MSPGLLLEHPAQVVRGGIDCLGRSVSWSGWSKRSLRTIRTAWTSTLCSLAVAARAAGLPGEFSSLLHCRLRAGGLVPHQLQRVCLAGDVRARKAVLDELERGLQNRMPPGKGRSRRSFSGGVPDCRQIEQGFGLEAEHRGAVAPGQRVADVIGLSGVEEQDRVGVGEEFSGGVVRINAPVRSRTISGARSTSRHGSTSGRGQLIHPQQRAFIQGGDMQAVLHLKLPPRSLIFQEKSFLKHEGSKFAKRKRIGLFYRYPYSFFLKIFSPFVIFVFQKSLS